MKNIFFILLTCLPSTLLAVVSPEKVDFPSTQVGSFFSEIEVTLKGPNSKAPFHPDINISGDYANDFTQQNDCPSPLPSGNSCKIKVTFSPTAEGTRSAFLNISNFKVNLTGTGTTTQANPELSISQTNLSFNNTNTTTNITIRNSGQGNLEEINVSLSGIHANHFSTSGCNNVSLTTQTCDITVSFNVPTDSMVRTASLEVTSSNGGNKLVTLEGVSTNNSNNSEDNNTNDSTTPISIEELKNAHVTAGNRHAIVITNDGRVFTWGENEYGQLGDNSYKDRNYAKEISIPKTDNDNNEIGIIKQLDASNSNHTAAVTIKGYVLTWGNNEYGQLGDGTKNNSQPIPTIVYKKNGEPLRNIKSVAVGEQHTLALSEDGTLWAWGDNHSEQLGDEQNHLYETYPIQVPDVSSVKKISAGRYHSLILKTNGEIWGWGNNKRKSVGGTASSYDLPHQITDSQGNPVTNIKDIIAGRDHSFAIREDGQILGWGQNDNYQLGSDDTGQHAYPIVVADEISNIVQLATNMGHTVARTSDNKLVTWGSNEGGELGHSENELYHSSFPVSVDGFTGKAVDIAVGQYFNVALKSDGSVVTWGGEASDPLLGSGSLSVSQSYIEVSVVNIEGQPISLLNSTVLDSDADGVIDDEDTFPNDPSESTDSDGDGVGNNADAFPHDPNESVDSDGDGVGNNADAFPNDPSESIDSDGDGVGNNADAFPNDPSESIDSDNDGIGNNADAFPNDPNESTDSDGDGIGNNADTDDDNDGLPDEYENQYTFLDPLNASDASTDYDGDNLSNLEEYQQETNPATVNSLTHGQSSIFETLSAGGMHTCALSIDGNGVCWGNNEYIQSTPPTNIFTQISAGYFHSCGLTVNNSVKCWGTVESFEIQPPNLNDVFHQISVGFDHTCGVKDNGNITCWGSNSRGQITSPLGSFLQVSSGGKHSCGLRMDGQVVCWGETSFGRLASPTGFFKQISSGVHHNCALQTEGKMECWGRNVEGQATPPDELFTKVSAGFYHTCGLKTDGKAVCWGRNVEGQATPPDELFATVSAGFYHTCGLKTDGEVVCWGNNTNNESTPPIGLIAATSELSITDIKENSSSSDSNESTSESIDSDGDGIGNSTDAFPNNPNESTDSDGDGVESNADSPDNILYNKMITVGLNHSCVLEANGNAVCWGQKDFGQATPPIGQFRDITGGDTYTCALDSNNGTACWGGATFLSSNQPLPDGFIKISSGRFHVCGLRADGKVICWGGNTAQQSSPPSGHFTQISSGDYHSCGLKNDGSITCWGNNDKGQSTPPTNNTFSQIGAGRDHSCALTSESYVVCWGGNYHGQSNPPTGKFSKIAIGFSHSCALKDDGSITCWGNNSRGQATPPSGSFVAIDAGWQHNCAIKNSGEVVCWGYNDKGQSTPPTGLIAATSGLLVTDSDSDNDGLPDEYENQYDFLNPLDVSDASADYDGDNLSNLEEYKQGTNPDDPIWVDPYGSVWIDMNANGVQDDDDASYFSIGLTGHSVKLTNQDTQEVFYLSLEQKYDWYYGTGGIVGNLNPDSDTIVPSGTYNVDIELPNGWRILTPTTQTINPENLDIEVGIQPTVVIGLGVNGQIYADNIDPDDIAGINGSHPGHTLAFNYSGLETIISYSISSSALNGLNFQTKGFEGQIQIQDNVPFVTIHQTESKYAYLNPTNEVRNISLNGNVLTFDIPMVFNESSDDPIYSLNESVGFSVTNEMGYGASLFARAYVPDTRATVDVGPDIEVSVGETVQFQGTVFDPDINDNHDIYWSFGDETDNVENTLTPTHIYSTVGTYQATLHAEIDAGEKTGNSDSLTVTVVEAEEKTIRLAVVNAPDNVKPGESFDLTFQFVPDTAQPADGIEVYIEFDPSKLQINSVTNSGVLDFELANEVGNNFIHFATSIWENEVPTEAFDLVTINVTALENTDDAESTTLHFVTDKSKVSSSGHFIPQAYDDIVINLSNPVANMILEPVALEDFGEVVITETSDSQVLKISNSGDAELLIESIIAIDGFPIEHNCDQPIAPGSNCQLTITFNPTEVKYYDALLTLASNASNGEQTLDLSGEGIEAPTLCQVSLQGRPIPPNPQWVTVLNVQTSGQQAITATDATGQCIFPEVLLPLEEGTNDICVKNIHTLRNKVQVISPLTTNVIDFGELLEGDTNNDNIINLNDMTTLLQNRGACENVAHLDLDASGCVDSNDSDLLRLNFNQVGENCDSNTRRARRLRDAKGIETTVSLQTTPIPSGLKVGSSFTFDIEIEAENGVDAASAYLNFPANKIEVTALTPGQAFDFVLQNEFNNAEGRINFAASIWENEQPMGKITLVTVHAILLEAGAESSFTFNTVFPRATQISSAGQFVFDSNQEGDMPQINVADSPYKLNVRVLDKLRQPISGASLQVANYAETTDEAGNAIFTKLSEGDYEIIATKNGYIFTPVDFSLGNEDYHKTIVLVPLSKLAVNVKAATRKPIKQGSTHSYTITVINGGSETATGIMLQDVIPEGAKVVSLSALDGDNCDTETVTCTLPDLTPGATAQVELVIGDLPANRIVNTATVSSNEYPDAFKKTHNHVNPYLSVTIDDLPDPVFMEGKLHYIIGVDLNEYGPKDTANNVRVTARLPEGVALDTVSTEHGRCETEEGKILCTLEDLSIGSPKAVSHTTIEVDVTLTDAGLLELMHEASVTADNYPTDRTSERTRIFVGEVKVDMVLVLDTTHSMHEEINGVIVALKQFIKERMDSSMQVALVEFKDNVRVRAFTHDMDVLLESVENLTVEGGGTCPEASVEALNLAVDHLKDGGVIFFSTDASPYEEADIDTLFERIQNKAIQLNAVISGDCSDGETAWND